jgi:hypothetical protein
MFLSQGGFQWVATKGFYTFKKDFGSLAVSKVCQRIP